MKGRDHFEDLGMDGKVLLECILKEIVREGVEWIHLAHYRVHWWSLVNMVLNLWVP
jgi:hypothetical protein